MPVGVDVQVLRGQLEVKNFQATCTVTTLECMDAGNFEKFTVDGLEMREVALQTEPLFGTGGKQFQVKVHWAASKGANGTFQPNLEKGIGLRLNLAAGSEPCFAKLRVEIINTDPVNNVGGEFRDFRKLNNAVNPGWSPESNNAILLLRNIFDSSRGWLHEGSLRVDLQLKIAIKHQSSTSSHNELSCQDSLSKDFGALLSGGDHTDLTIKVKGEELRAHALIVMARSPVFASMLSLPMREATERTVTISDLSMIAVKAMITFMYTGEVDEAVLKSDSNTLGVLEAAHRYNVPSLVDLCAQSLFARLNIMTVSEWFHIADLIGNTQLRTGCLEFMHLHIAEVQATDAFTKFIAPRPALLRELLASLFPPAKRQRISE